MWISTKKNICFDICIISNKIIFTGNNKVSRRDRSSTKDISQDDKETFNGKIMVIHYNGIISKINLK